MSYWSMICAWYKDPFFPLPFEIYLSSCRIKRKSIKLRPCIITTTTTIMESPNNLPNMEKARHRPHPHPPPAKKHLPPLLLPTACIWRPPMMRGRYDSWNRHRTRVKSSITIPTELPLFHLVPFGRGEGHHHHLPQRNIIETPWSWSVVERIVKFISGMSSNQSTCPHAIYMAPLEPEPVH